MNGLSTASDVIETGSAALPAATKTAAVDQLASLRALDLITDDELAAGTRWRSGLAGLHGSHGTPFGHQSGGWSPMRGCARWRWQRR